MAVAYFRSWAPRGFWQSFQLPGMEASILFCFLFLFLWAAGPGAWSLEELLRPSVKGARVRTRPVEDRHEGRTWLATIAVLVALTAAPCRRNG